MLISGSLPNLGMLLKVGKLFQLNSSVLWMSLVLQGSVLPAFIIGVVGANFEKWVRKYVPGSIGLY